MLTYRINAVLNSKNGSRTVAHKEDSVRVIILLEPVLPDSESGFFYLFQD